MNLNELEFSFKPHFCNECIFSSLAWCEISLKLNIATEPLQRLVFPVRRGSTFHGIQLLPYMDQLTTMFMSTTRGLPA